jgi:ABC-type taurine transport system ATPase subunit
MWVKLHKKAIFWLLSAERSERCFYFFEVHHKTQNASIIFPQLVLLKPRPNHVLDSFWPNTSNLDAPRRGHIFRITEKHLVSPVLC